MIPAVDIMDHRVVQLVGGIPGSEVVTLDDPLAVAKNWVEKGAPYLHIVDLDGAFGRDNNITIIKKIARECGVPVEVGGGIRSEDTIKELLNAGVDRVIVGTKGITDLKWLRSICFKFPRRIVLALDTKNGEITVKGWQESFPMSLDDMFNVIAEIPLAAVLNTNVDVEGQGMGIDSKRAIDFIRRCPHDVIASGGVSSREDAKTLSRSGAIGAVVGIAIYTGSLEPWDWDTPWKS